MKQRIDSLLRDIEAQQGVKILYAVECGSRAWGFAAPDSDYDVRYVYLRPREEYLRLDPWKETLDGPKDETLDVVGWDLRKALILLGKANPSLAEWVHSPIVYRNTRQWQALMHDFDRFFSPGKTMLHYHSQAQVHLKKILGQSPVTVKQYLHTLRPILCCRYLAREGTMPPADFDTLCRRVLPRELAEVTAQLLERKRAGLEECPHDPGLDDFIRREIPRLKEEAGGLPDPEGPGLAQLNRMFLEALDHTWPGAAGR